MANAATTKRAIHRLPSSSSGGEGDRRPRKAARQAEPSSDADELLSESDVHAVAPADLTQRLLAVQQQQEPEQSAENEDAGAKEGPSEVRSEPAGNNDEDDDEEEVEQPSPLQPAPFHRLDAHRLAQLAATVLRPLPDTVQGATFSYESNLAYGGQSAAGVLTRIRRWTEEDGYETFGDGYDEYGELIEESNQDDAEQRGLSTPPPEIPPSEPSSHWSGSWYDEHFDGDDPDETSQPQIATLAQEREPFGVDGGAQYAAVLAAGGDPKRKDGKWPVYTPEPRGTVASDSQTPEANPLPKGAEEALEEAAEKAADREEEDEDDEEDDDSGDSEDQDDSDDEMDDGDGGGEMDDGDGGGEDGGGKDGARDAGDGDAGGQEQGGGDEGDGRSDGQQDDDEHASEANQPGAEDVEMEDDAGDEDGNSDSEPAQPPTVLRPSVILTPTGGLPNQQYAGRITRRMAAEIAARNTPLPRGQGYPFVGITELQHARMLRGVYGGEPDSDEDEDEDGDDEGETE